jgi:hypothetical protein
MKGSAKGPGQGGTKNRGRNGQASGYGEAVGSAGEYAGSDGGSLNGGRNEKKGDGKRDGRKSAAHNRRQTSGNQKSGTASHHDKKGRFFAGGPKWEPVKKPDEPIPEFTCSSCGKPIGDIASAICDHEEGRVFHFDCLLTRLKQNETLDEGDDFAYIGGGRFGIVHHDSRKKFSIKKIIEWDHEEERVHWRKLVADHFSST